MTHDIFISWNYVYVDNGIPRGAACYMNYWNEDESVPYKLIQMIVKDYPRWSSVDNVRLISCDDDGDFFDVEYDIMKVRLDIEADINALREQEEPKQIQMG